ncbi:SLC13 family permease [Salinicoccus sp. HZC-1]|uniref:SLC13 family permease n=1 Tax=Salinicoccus sp. HZC-1 TaxID=3385497 RepID=UPI00398B4C7D
MQINRRRFTLPFNIIVLSIIITLVFIAPSTFLQDFNPEQQRTVGLLVLAIYLWTISPLPSGAASILLLAMMLILNLVDSVEGAMTGFLSSALYFILILTILSRVLIKAGVDKVVASQLLKLNKRGPKAIVVALPLMIAMLPVLMPSAFARLKMLLPFVDRLNDAFGFSDRSIFKKYALYVIGLMNQNGTMIVYTGGGFPVLAAQLLSDYNVADLGWLQWFLIIAPPLWAALLLVNVFTWNYLNHSYPSEILKEPESQTSQTEEYFETALERKRFWFVIATFGIMIVTWAITDNNIVPTLLPPMLLLVVYSLPKVGLLTNADIRAFDWENFLLLGASFSIGILLEENGTASVIAEQMLQFVPEDSGMILKIILIALITFAFRMIFIVPSSAIIVIFPVIISYANIADIPALSIAFLVIMIVGGTNIFPIHSPTSYFAFQTGVLSKKDHYVIATFSTCIFITMAILAASSYWMLW